MGFVTTRVMRPRTRPASEFHETWSPRFRRSELMDRVGLDGSGRPAARASSPRTSWALVVTRPNSLAHRAELVRLGLWDAADTVTRRPQGAL